MTDMNIKRHLSEDDFKKWDSGQMSDDEMEFFLSHTAVCETCADNWMRWMERADTELLPEPPVYLGEEILARSKQPDILIARKVNRTSKQIRLLTYSLKVGTAVVLSILMLFSVNLTGLKLSSISEPSQPAPISSETAQTSALPDRYTGQKGLDITGHMRKSAQSITSSLQDFTNFIFNFEFNFNQED
ncbi:MAG: hypothetical protein Q4F21_03035 [Lachnospiraceae bacterium]|nr:hypothetical protein [Lachnospiraceae bacterium]